MAKSYVRLTWLFAAAQWLKTRSHLALDRWWKHNEGRTTPPQSEWWLNHEILRETEAAAGRTFTEDYTAFVRQLNDRARVQGKRYPLVLFMSDRRDSGELHEDGSSGGAPVSAFGVMEYARTRCHDALAAYSAARDTAAQNGTYPSLLRIAAGRIVVPAALIVTGATSAVLAYQGFRQLFWAVVVGP